MEPIKDFEKIHLNLENCIVPKDRLLNTPSRKFGMSHELEVDLRVTGCEYIQTAGLLLQLPQVAMATAQVLFQRFYYAKSFTDFKVRVSLSIINFFVSLFSLYVYVCDFFFFAFSQWQWLVYLWRQRSKKTVGKLGM